MAMVNAKQVPFPQTSTALPYPSARVSYFESLMIPSAFADEIEPDGTKVFSLPSESFSQQFQRGYFGWSPNNIWYVIVGSFRDKQSAFAEAAAVREKGFSADVYQPYEPTNPLFSVVIGAQMSWKDAEVLKLKALNARLSPNTHVWTFPQMNPQ